VTLVCHSKTLTVAQKAADQLAEQNVSAEVLDLRPSGRGEAAILQSVRKTTARSSWKKVPHIGIGAQVVDLIQRDAFDDLDAPVQRVTQADVPMPYNKFLERAAKAHPRKSWPPRAACCTSNSPRPWPPKFTWRPCRHDGGRAPREVDEAQGDPVKSGDTLAEVETDKAVMS